VGCKPNDVSRGSRCLSRRASPHDTNVSFYPLAEQELNDAAQYHELESAGLGAAFLTEVQRCCAGIVEYPKLVRLPQVLR
jgi:hypothetical protein